MSIMCVYQDCLSVKYPCSRTAFFRLPNDDRRSTWIRNSGNKHLLKIGPKAQRFFCEHHFRECDINSQFTRKLLRRDAVPIEHSSLVPSKQDLEKAYTYVEGSIDTTNKLENNHEHTGLVESIEENSDYQNLFEEIKSLDTSATTDTPADESCGVPYRLLKFYVDDGEEPSTARIMEEKADEDITKTSEKPRKRESLEIYIEENSNNNQVDSSTIELDEQNNLEDIDSLDDNPREYMIPAKRKRPNDMETPVETPSNEIIELVTPKNNNSYEEDKHFALSLVGYFQRLPQGKKAMAKLKILQYLTELEIDLPTSL